MPLRKRTHLGRKTRNTAIQAAIRRDQAIPNRTEDIYSSTRILEADELYFKQFDDTLKNMKYVECSNCSSERFVKSTEYFRCSHCVKTPQKFTAANNMDPGNAPLLFNELSEVEKQFIARVHPVVKVYQLKSAGRDGQFRYKGNVINIAQDVTKIASSLPLLPSEITTLVIRKGDTSNYTDFKVRRAKVQQALEYLVTNNPYYRDIVIDHNRLQQLPVDGEVSNELRNIDDTTSPQTHVNITDDDVQESALPSSNYNKNQEKCKVILSWPEASDSPISEFTTEGYITMAFPHLFPNGLADFNDRSRSIKVTFTEWSEHLIRHKDRRFAKDARFRFFVLNTNQRKQALQKSALYARKTDFEGGIVELREKIASEPSFLNKIMCWGSQIRGSNAYWYQRRMELESMVQQQGVPTIFLTISAADLWWPCLIRHYGLNENDVANISEFHLGRLTQRALSNNPLIGDEYFTERITVFFNVLSKRYNILDYWGRFEYQHRGSPHFHCVIWLANAPDVRSFDTATSNQLQSAKEYYDKLVSAVNPMPATSPADIHPCRIYASDCDTRSPVQWSQLMNRVNRHTKCTASYCLRGRPLKCRFNFPKDLLSCSTLEKNEKGHCEYTPERNDPLLNSFNPFTLMMFRANTDCQVIASKHSIVAYISKYASKGEKQSSSLLDMVKATLQEKNDNTSFQSGVSSILMKLIGERDISAPEVMHLITGKPLYHCTRQFLKLVLTEVEYTVISTTDQQFTDDDEPGNNILHSYMKRPNSNRFSTMSLKTFASSFNVSRKKKYTEYKKRRVLRVIPTARHDSELHFFQQLALAVPFRHLSELKTHETWELSYKSHNLNDWKLPEPDDVEEDIQREVELEQREWMAIAEAIPHNVPKAVEIGYRDFDRNFNWFESYHCYNDHTQMAKFIELLKTNGFATTHVSGSEVALNFEQQRVMSHLIAVLDGTSNKKLSIITGPAGTGKSCVIKQMTIITERKFGAGSVLLLAPTGVAANNICGKTIHSALHLNPNTRIVADLKGETEHDYQLAMEKVKVIIVDEFSMIGLKLLSAMDQRLRQAAPQRSSQVLGGFIVYLFGDINQLPPVLDKPLYAKPTMGNELAGRVSYSEFKNVFKLNTIMRQQGESQKLFRDALTRLSNDTITESDYNLLSTRFRRNIPATELSAFDTCIQLVSKKGRIADINDDQLKQLDNPVTVIHAVHNNQTAATASSEDAQGLPATLKLAIGARVMLRNNLWTECGLCNGSIGIVTDIVYNVEDSLKCHLETQPMFILVTFDNYTGPSAIGRSIPVPAVKAYFKKNGVSCNRAQFPLQLAYAMTIHKSQGITVPRAVVDIDEHEFTVGLSYVGLSRVRTLDGLMLDPPFPRDRLQKIPTMKMFQKRQQEIARLNSLHP